MRAFLAVVALAPALIAVAAAPACKKEETASTQPEKPVRACEQGLEGKLLAQLLDADEPRAFGKALRLHGPVQASELPCLIDAAAGASETRSRSAATLLLLVRGDDAAVRAEQIRIAGATGDVVVWATLARKLLDEKPKADDTREAIERPEMIERALRFAHKTDRNLEAQTHATGLRAGLAARSPGIDEELGRRLDARDSSLLVALDALPPERAKAELPRLLKRLEAYEAKGEFPGSPGEAFTSIVRALIRSGDATADAATRAALAKDFKDPESTKGSRPELMTFTNTVTFQNEPEIQRYFLRVIRDGHVLVPVAFAVLATQVWANKAPPSVELVKACVALPDRVEGAGHAIHEYNRVQCGHLLYFMATGENPIDTKQLKSQPGADLAHAREWLRACETSHSCAP